MTTEQKTAEQTVTDFGGVNIHVTCGTMGDIFKALNYGITIAKALQLETVSVRFYNGIIVVCKKDSNLSDLVEIYQLREKLVLHP